MAYEMTTRLLFNSSGDSDEWDCDIYDEHSQCLPNYTQASMNLETDVT